MARRLEPASALAQAAEAELGTESLQERLLAGERRQHELERHLGELDFQFKRQAQVISGIVDGVAEVKAHFDASGRAAKQ